MFTIGCHVSVSGGYEMMGKTTLAIGGNTFQYFTRNPRGSRGTKTPSAADVAALRALMEEHHFAPALAHAPYTYNPASKEENIRQYTRDAMAEELRFLESLPGSLYNFHPGCHVGQGMETGIVLIADLLNAIVLPDQSTTVLLETMAGKGTEIGGSFEELAAILSGVRLQEKVGVCLDTCHISDGGYDVSDPDGVLAEFDRVIGLGRLRALHVNDSRHPQGSRKDRHARLGEGTIGQENLVRFLRHPALLGLPCILETPNDLGGYAREIRVLRKALQGA